MGNGLDGGHGGGDRGASPGPSGKAALRRSILSSRAASDPAARASDDARLAARVVGWIASQVAAGPATTITIAAHVPVDVEPGATSLTPDQLLSDLAAAAEAEGMPPVRLLLPVCPPGPPAALQWAEYRGARENSGGVDFGGVQSGGLAPGKYGLPEPVGPRLEPDALAQAEIIIVPGVAADRSGMRMGRGAGYYDRSLAHATGRVAAILHPGEVVDAVPHDAHDVPVDAVITADELIIPGS
ncbi:5-formyltetrahydrofolate cyclo-ligase [Corynebacterium sp. NPDC060344]|uniref:5-formyltetrahydrofolate cyclo-ligase n=1 Tax=Corynebacterium sp. NPDC060344 TaxID=3347101 RepID=UPI00364DB0F6